MKSKKRSARQYICFVIFVIVALINIYPLVFSIFCSFKGNLEIFSSFTSLPKRLRFENYITAWKVGNIGRYFLNTIILSVGTLVIAGLFGAMASYVLAKFRFRGKSKIYLLFISGMMIPIHATLLPNYKIYSQLGLTDTIWALLIPYVAFSLPQGLFLMTSFIDQIPLELEEAAIMDGCGIYRIIFRIITPMLKPSIATVAIMAFLNNWNEFMMASTYLSSPKWKTLPFSVLEFTGQYSSNYAVQFAVMALTAAPAVIVYIILNKHITKGVAMGAVKG